jgi:hypothetical protein
MLGLFFGPEDEGDMSLRNDASDGLHGVLSQKRTLFKLNFVYGFEGWTCEFMVHSEYVLLANVRDISVV